MRPRLGVLNAIREESYDKSAQSCDDNDRTRRSCRIRLLFYSVFWHSCGAHPRIVGALGCGLHCGFPGWSRELYIRAAIEVEVQFMADVKYGHYTTQAGLLAMIRDEILWATNIKFLNDEHEFLHAIGLIKDIISTQKKTP
jgi:hypothetical protein